MSGPVILNQDFDHQTPYDPYFESQISSGVQMVPRPSPKPLEYSPTDENPFSLNPEVFFVAFLLLLLPIVIYLAYRYGKKMGRKESGPTSTENGLETVKRRSSQESTSDNSLYPGPVANSKSSSVYNSPILKPASEVLSGNILSDNHNSPPSSTDIKKRERSVQMSDLDKHGEFMLSDQEGLRNSTENRMLPYAERAVKEGGDDDLFTFAYEHKISKIGSEKSEHGFADAEKVRLHDSESDVVDRKMKYEISVGKKDGVLMKTEKQETIVKYDPNAEGPEKNAKKYLEPFRISGNGSSHPLQLALSPTLPPRSSKLLALEADSVLDPQKDQKEAPVGLTIFQNLDRKGSVAESPALSTNRLSLFGGADQRVESIMEKYGFPDETGKFNRVFKDVTEIGAGSFGQVYKVKHKLDSKFYAVKKVNLKLKRFEDLKNESKVFREVFAMTDLHHPNIVRYSTCWVEIEFEKPKVGGGDQQNLGDISENVKSEEEASELESEPADYSKNSDMGFEWAASSGEKEKKKNKTIEEAPKMRRRKNSKIDRTIKRISSNLQIKTLSKSFIEEDPDENSSLSRVESISELPGCKIYLYIQMEYCSGQSLRYFLENTKSRIHHERSLEMFRKLLEGVHAIHSRGILHRDLKPANIFLDGNENVKIGDFGLASLDKADEEYDAMTPSDIKRRATKQHSMKVGTPMYTSHEQENGGHYDHKTDIYSLGLIFYELMVIFATHHERYEHFGLIRAKHQLPDDFVKGYPSESELILAMTSKAPDARPTAEQLIMEVDKLLESIRGKMK